MLANAGAALALVQLCLTLGLSARASLIAMWTYALGFGTRVEVVEPPSLRERVVRAAREVVAFYAGEGDSQ